MASFQALFLRRRVETSASQDWRVGARIQLPTGEYGCFPSTAPNLSLQAAFETFRSRATWSSCGRTILRCLTN